LRPYIKLSPSAGLLHKDDVLLAVDGRAVANDGTVSFRGWERVSFDHLISLKQPGEEALLQAGWCMLKPVESAWLQRCKPKYDKVLSTCF